MTPIFRLMAHTKDGLRTMSLFELFEHYNASRDQKCSKRRESIQSKPRRHKRFPSGCFVNANVFGLGVFP